MDEMLYVYGYEILVLSGMEGKAPGTGTTA
jgi:hypothetical protein